MKCNEAKTLIITDLVDHELSAENAPVLNNHLAECPQCRKYKEEVLLYAVNPFKTMERKTPPQEIWANIKSSIEQNSAPAFSLKGLFDGLLTFPKSAFIPFAAAMLLLISFMVYKQPAVTTVNTTANIQSVTEMTDTDHQDYINEVLEPMYTVKDHTLGTTVEEYLL